MPALSLREFETQARGLLDPTVYDYFAGGADDEPGIVSFAGAATSGVTKASAAGAGSAGCMAGLRGPSHKKATPKKTTIVAAATAPTIRRLSRHRDSSLRGQASSGVRTSQPKFSNLGEFFQAIFGVDGHEHVQISGSC